MPGIEVARASFFKIKIFAKKLSKNNRCMQIDDLH
jgi:hypothetical protein